MISEIHFKDDPLTDLIQKYEYINTQPVTRNPCEAPLLKENT